MISKTNLTVFTVQSCPKSLNAGFLGSKSLSEAGLLKIMSLLVETGAEHLVSLSAKHLVAVTLKVQGEPGVTPH